MNTATRLNHLECGRIQAISLDLDDTLWPVWPTIHQAEAALLAWMDATVPGTAQLWRQEGVPQRIRKAVFAQHPDMGHDFSFLRREMIRSALREAGDPHEWAESGFDVFFAARQQVELFPEVQEALVSLAVRYPLLGLSNGNANLMAMPIGACFRGHVAARDAGFAKPDRRIFELAAQQLNVPVHGILHVGDDPVLDVQAALAVGMQAVWLNRDNRAWPEELPALDRECVAVVSDLQQLQQVLLDALLPHTLVGARRSGSDS